jgi:alpha-tubulin suppressor-like RCC1 family protein
MSLNKHRVKQVALGRWHTLCLTYGGKVFTWGRNNRGQLGRGYSSEMETEPGLALDINSDHDHGLKISAGMLHSVAIIRVSQISLIFTLITSDSATVWLYHRSKGKTIA